MSKQNLLFIPPFSYFGSEVATGMGTSICAMFACLVGGADVADSVRSVLLRGAIEGILLKKPAPESPWPILGFFMKGVL
jgi:hypothetical protein